MPALEAGICKSAEGTIMDGKNTGPRALVWVTCALAMGIAQAQTGTEVVLHNFAPYYQPHGASPVASVTRDPSGNLYGTTDSGGPASAGVVFAVNPAGREKVLYAFTGGADGGSPTSGVILDSAGNLYGATHNGGASNAGVVYKVDRAGQETVLYTFTGGPDGGYPSAGVIRDAAGNLYGTTNSGGASNAGVVYKVDTGGTETVLYSFTGGADGGTPFAGVVADSSGNLYGTTSVGGSSASECAPHGCGVVFEVTQSGQETVLHTFNGQSGGGYPDGGVIRDSSGNLYGTTVSGGSGFVGVVYKLDTTGKETVLYNFTGRTDGTSPETGVVRDAAGNLYGTTSDAGLPGGCGGFGCGVVYKVDTSGQETVLYTFTGGTDGANPSAGVILDSSGNVYGTTIGGGIGRVGVVFKVNTTDEETVVYGFPGPVDGIAPQSGVIADAAGNLYGTAPYGGISNSGVIYKLDVAGNETVLCTFTGGVDGAYPDAGVIRDSAGNLYGTTYNGGTADAGVVFELDANGQETVLHNFTGGADGGNPYAGVIRDSAGNLYGTTEYGGAANLGAVFKVDTSGEETVLFSFPGGNGGSNPYGGVTADSAGNLYGTTAYGGSGGSGVVFKLDPAGTETVLHTFKTPNDGAAPESGVIRDSAGNLYGTTYGGGKYDAGVVYKVAASGQETVLYTFTGGADGGSPVAGVIMDSAGNLYGTAQYGGASHWGVVFEVNTSSQEIVLYNFAGGTGDGSRPLAGVIRNSAGVLFGTTSSSGTNDSGVVYQLTPQ